MATTFTFPKAPRVGDRIEIVSISETRLPINIVANSEASKTLELVFPDITYSGTSSSGTIASITEKNTVYTFKCVSAQEKHTWVLEGTCLYAKVSALETQLSELSQRVSALEGTADDLEAI